MREIKLFGRALNVNGKLWHTINTMATRKGYIVHPDCLNNRVLDFLDTLPDNLNSTFYKSWSDVVGKTRVELALDQIMHYASTYGTGHTGTAYIPNANPVQIDFTDVKVIMPITKEEIQKKIQDMFNSGIALKQETIDDCIALINELDLVINFKTIKNREVMMYVCNMLGIYPDKPEEMVRYLVYILTNKTLLIKSNEVLREIKGAINDVTGNGVGLHIQRYGLERLSSVFHRFKPIFLAMKTKDNARVINQLRRNAESFHKPYQKGYWETILNADPGQLDALKLMLPTLNNFKKIALIQAIRIRKADPMVRPFGIRNGKLFIKEQMTFSKEYYDLLESMLMDSLVSSLRIKRCKVKLPAYLNLTMPTSEKSFIGNIPFGSYVKLNEEGIVGIHWKGEDGAQDLDLSLVDNSGNRIGWNSAYYNDTKSVVYSGDVTRANPEATELLYFSKGCPDGVVKLNLYYGDEKSKYHLFFANAKPGYEVGRNTMVDPNDVRFMTKLEMSSKEMMCGIMVNGKFQFANIRTGNKQVSRGNSITSLYIDYCKSISGTYLGVKDILRNAGFEIVDSGADIDLSVLDRSALIALLS